MEHTIALAGNPNSGKTTLYNELTGAHQHVGNYPGVTVEKKHGTYIYNGYKATIVDLPGTYSLSAYSLEEVVARNFLVDEKPAVVINIVDASNLERNLYLTLQFMELGVPVCIALNMMDVAKTRGIEIDTQKLSKLLRVPVIPTIARSGEGKKALMETALELMAKVRTQSAPDISYGNDVDNALQKMENIIAESAFMTDIYPARFTALKYLEADELIIGESRKSNREISAKLEKITERVSKHLHETLGINPEAMIADHRYGCIKAMLKQGVIKYAKERNRLHLSDKIDKVVTDRLAGPLIMAAVLLGLYHFTFTYSETPVGWMGALFEWLGATVDAYLPDGLVKSLMIAGIIDGVGGVMGFVPIIMFMFFGISLLEDSGYLARVAFMLDRVFRIFGLHGSSVMPFIVSGGIAGGCAVPGVMASRTLKSPNERLATLLTVPFMNCGAKLPVFAMLIAAFFASNQVMIMAIITIISWMGALLAAKFLRAFLIKGESTPFIMELPPYRVPTIKGICIHTWERTWQYVKKAGTIILGISILLWAMMTFPGLPDSKMQLFEQKRQHILAEISTFGENQTANADDESRLSENGDILKDRLTAIDAKEAEEALRNSFAGRIGRGLEGISKFMGFDWRTNIALVGGFAAKEVVVSTLGTAYSLGEVDTSETATLSEKLAASPEWTPLTAFSLIIFMIFYAPCFVTIVAIVRESGSWKWGLFSMTFNTFIAFVFATAVFQLGTFLGL